LGNHQQAKEHYEHVLSIQLNKLGPEHIDVRRPSWPSASWVTVTCVTISGIGNAGNHPQAKERYERALSILLKRRGPDHSDACMSRVSTAPCVSAIKEVAGHSTEKKYVIH